MKIILHLTEDVARPEKFWKKSGGIYLDWGSRILMKSGGEVIELERGKARKILMENVAGKLVINAIPPGDVDYGQVVSKILLLLRDRVKEAHIFLPDPSTLSPHIKQMIAEQREEYYLTLDEATTLGKELGLSAEKAAFLSGLTYLEAMTAIESGKDLVEATTEIKERRLKHWGATKIEPPECLIFQDVLEWTKQLMDGRFRIVLTGLTGSGKTHLALSCKKYYRGPGYALSCSEFIRKAAAGPFARATEPYRELLKTLEEMAPLYLVLNEFEAAVAGEVGYKLLEWLESEKTKDISIAATTVALGSIDPQVIRPGRFDAVALMPLPSSEERIILAKEEARKLGLTKEETQKCIYKAEEMSGATPAEIIQMVKTRGEIEWNIGRERLTAYMQYIRLVKTLPHGKIFRIIETHQTTRNLYKTNLPRGLM